MPLFPVLNLYSQVYNHTIFRRCFIINFHFLLKFPITQFHKVTRSYMWVIRVIYESLCHIFSVRNKSNLGFPILRSFSNLVRYHLGTVAMGSLIIALVQLIRSILAAIQYQLKGQENAVSRCLFRTCQCCLYCFEKILKYLSRNAYIETGMWLLGFSFDCYALCSGLPDYLTECNILLFILM